MKVLLIGGTPSSGSTFLVYLLSKNGAFLCLPETGLFTQGRVFSTGKKSTNRLHHGVPWVNIKEKAFQATGWTLQLEEDKEGFFSPIDILKNQLNQETTQIIVEKTPENIFAFHHYLLADPERKVVVTSRKLEDSCFSLMKRKFTMVEALMIWFAHAYEVFCLIEAFPRQVFHVPYEKLCLDPNSIVTRIVDFLQVKVDSLPNTEDLNHQYQWMLKQSSWLLSNRYWSKEIDSSYGHQPSDTSLGIEFESFTDVAAFKTCDGKLVRPRDLNHCLHGNQIPLPSNLSGEGYGPVKFSPLSLIIRSLMETYPLHIKKVS